MDIPTQLLIWRRALAVLAAALLVALVGARSWHGRGAHAAAADAAAAPAVAVARVGHEDLFREITIPAEFRPYTEVELHAKVSGYVKAMKVDIGDRVKAGQLLAVLEVPELTDDRDHAQATYRRAQADYRDAHLAYTRLVAVNRDHPNLIAQQDLDTAEARDATAEGAQAAAKADVDKYQTLVGYTRIVAPFDGVITKRYADPGALIQAGTASNTQAMPLVRISENTLLRLDFPVSVDYVRGIHLDAPVNVSVDSLGGRVFSGTVKRFSGKVDDATRTMVVEMEVPNAALELVPGMYATVTLRLDERPHALAIPIEAVPPGGKSVLIVNAGHEVEQRGVTLGLETPARYEVLAGLKEGDLVMIGNPAQLAPGQRVEPRVTAPLARE
jgi:RND family efflux transporter MFP subunit